MQSCYERRDVGSPRGLPRKLVLGGKQTRLTPRSSQHEQRFENLNQEQEQVVYTSSADCLGSFAACEAYDILVTWSYDECGFSLIKF